MKIRNLLAAALVAGVSTSLSHAEETPNYAEQIAVFSAKKASQNAGKTGEEAGGSLLRDFIRGGRGSQAAETVKIDRTTTSSVTTSTRKTVKASTRKSAKTSASKSAKGGSYQTIIAQYASAYGVPVSLAHAVVRIESNYRANARGSAGEVGLMQIKPSTARMLGYRGSVKGLYHPETNIKYGMKYLAQAHKLGGGTTCGTILKYNAGHGAKRMNPVSSAYCAKVKRILGR
ncbi:lytic transglycosylase domain-containing protein [Nitratireductor sp. ZSWI3]|uniref:lytic transglycosylase domain-containing protein n=1 Tax=Nitratireductor sp. ZSWI3 TaxID=2966359 RepID=UPI00214F9562|nr:transglycosylase SLT domain-containing protein [Nitratireductor sp. ZSWI3]MCR4266060.1 transglycosylase SLT domain-containing protein [Nitratireductor sp. ZSWI3]